MKRSTLMIVFLVIAQLGCIGEEKADLKKEELNGFNSSQTLDLERLIESSSVGKSDSSIKKKQSDPKKNEPSEVQEDKGDLGDKGVQGVKEKESAEAKNSKLLKNSKKVEENEEIKKGFSEKKLDKFEKPPQEKSMIKKVLTSVIHVVQAIAGIYICLFGFRVFRLLMILLGFFTSYYLILFFLTEYEIFDQNSVGPQIALFVFSIFLGFVISVLSYMFDRVNFIIFGLSVGCMFGLFYAQFFVDFADTQDRILLFIVVLVTSGLVIVAAYFMLDMTVIVGSAFIGSIITPISIGILFDYFDSFEERSRKDSDFVRQLYAFLVASGLMFLVGIPAQMHLRTRILTKFEDESLEETGSQSFVN